jgi:protoheme IX farnesyltransferase
VTQTKDIKKNETPTLFKDWMVFTKMRLASLVILSAIAGYLFAGGGFDQNLLLLIVGGIFVTGASNGVNQLLERDLDKKMKRTMNRPVAAGRMTVQQGLILVLILIISGTVLLALINFKTALWGFISFLLYSFVYTPMKPKTSWAVFVGAIPGAFPPFLGAIAFLDEYSLIPGILFMVQFMWQFPHFWAIAWVLYDDYKHGGFNLLPSKNGKTKTSAFPILVYTLLLVPFSLLPWVLDMVGPLTFYIGSFLGLIFFLFAYRLYLTCDTKDARKLMFASFVYLPLIQFLYVLDKI